MMAMNKLRLSLTAYDPNPSEVALGFNGDLCTVEESSGANISVEEYKTTPEGGPSEICLKVTPDPIAFVMKFVDGKMNIEFKGDWASFQIASKSTSTSAKSTPLAAPASPMVTASVNTKKNNSLIDLTPKLTSIPTPEPLLAQKEANQEVIKNVEEHVSKVMEIQTASSEICFKVHLNQDDVDAHDLRMNWDYNELKRLNGDGVFEIVHQETTDKGRIFIIAIKHPVTGETFVLRGCVNEDRVTVFNTDIFNEEDIIYYLQFYIKDEDKIREILVEMEANPDKRISILYKHGAFAQAVDIPSFITYMAHKDADKKSIKSKDTDNDDHVQIGKDIQKKAVDSGKKGSEAPNNESDSEWSCGRVKFDLPKEERKLTLREVGRLKIPDLSAKEEGPHLQDVGKLKWDGFTNNNLDEKKKKSVVEKPKVGKLNLGAFAVAAQDAAAPPPKRTWKKRGSTTPSTAPTTPTSAEKNAPSTSLTKTPLSAETNTKTNVTTTNETTDEKTLPLTAKNYAEANVPMTIEATDDKIEPPNSETNVETNAITTTEATDKNTASSTPETNFETTTP